MEVNSLCRLLFVLICGCAVYAGCTSDPPAASNQQPPATNDVVSRSTRLATISDNEKPVSVDHAAPTNGSFYCEFSKSGNSVAYIAKVEDKKYVVFNGVPGRPYANIFNMRISPDGRRVAYVVELLGKNSMVVDGVEGPLYDDIAPPVFSPDSRHIAVKVMYNDHYYVVVDGKVSSGYRSLIDEPLFSSDSLKVAYSEGADDKHQSRSVVSELELKNSISIESCGDQLIACSNKTRVASVCSIMGKQQVIEFSFAQIEKRNQGALYDSVSHLSFSRDGSALVYTAEKGGATYLVLNGREERLPKADLVAVPVIRPDLKGVGVIAGTPGKVFFRQSFKDTGTKENNYEMIEDLVYNKDGSIHAYSALKADKWRIVVNGKEGPVFDRVIGPSFGPDGALLVYRARQDGRRFVVVADATGTIVRRHQSYELVYTPVFTADGNSVAYGVKDGKELWWKVEKLK